MQRLLHLEKLNFDFDVVRPWKLNVMRIDN